MRRILPAVCLAFACAVAVNAQTTTPTTQPQPTDRSQDRSKMQSQDRQSVTLTGCVRQGDEPNTFVLADVDARELDRAMAPHGTQTGTSAGTTSSSTPGSTTGTATGSTPSSATGTTGARPGSADRPGRTDEANTVQLVDSGNVNLKPHVGHKVQITGTLAAPGMDRDRKPSGTAGTAGSTSTPSPSDTTARPGSYGERDKDMNKDKKNKHKVNVQSLKMISESCQ